MCTYMAMCTCPHMLTCTVFTHLSALAHLLPFLYRAPANFLSLEGLLSHRLLLHRSCSATCKGNLAKQRGDSESKKQNRTKQTNQPRPAVITYSCKPRTERRGTSAVHSGNTHSITRSIKKPRPCANPKLQDYRHKTTIKRRTGHGVG